MTFDIGYSNQAVRFLRKADKLLAARILDKIETLADEPVSHDTKKIHGSKALFRVRVGDFRILYEISYEENHIGIVKIDKRDAVYERR